MPNKCSGKVPSRVGGLLYSSLPTRGSAVALRFYNASKGHGEGAADVSSFFRRRDLPKQLQSYLAGPGRSHQKEIKKAAEKFRTEFEEWMAG
jgi:hypothetical protein